MTRKSDGEKIDELEKSMARVVERLDTAIGAHERLSGEHGKTVVITHDLRREVEREFALLKRDIDELKKWKEDQKHEQEERSRRAWAFGPNVLGALINVLLSAVVAYLVSRR